MEKQKMALATKMLIALVLGIALGFGLQVVAPIGATNIIRTHFIDGVLFFVGELFLNGIFMIVVPLIFVSLVVGITSIPDPKKVGRIGGKLAGIYILSTFPAIGAAMFFGTVLNPARGVTEESIAAFAIEPTIGTPPGVYQILINIVPRNPFAALSTGQTLQVIFIAVAIALAINAIGEAAQPLRRLFVSTNEVIMKVTSVVMSFAPYGVFALLARTFSMLGLDAIVALIGFVLVVWLALAFHLVFIYGGALKLLVGKNPHTGKSLSLAMLFKKTSPALTFAFSSASSAATLPVTMRCARNLGFSRELASIGLPMGVTLNMDGTAIFQGVAAVFLASFLGIHLSAGDIITILITATMATLGAAGVPGAGMIMLSMVLMSIGIPIGAIAFIFGIDRIVDMPRTAINVFGDIIYSFIVGKQEGMIDWAQYSAPTDLASLDAMLAKEDEAALAAMGGGGQS
ncbi:MAG: dicarboxylate/amino acid:cation symporter [Spirochaetes bacterium]|nr:dicarboxylate/amino acid:cation symporter [Spirochaetota bacterium]